jgi:hypothetical protein
MDRQGRNVLGQMDIILPGRRLINLLKCYLVGKNREIILMSESIHPVSAVYASQRYFLQSSAAFGNASYVRVRNLSVSYKCTSALLQTLHLQNLRFYLRGQNLFTFSRYKNLDPENVDYNNSSMPPLRVVTAGFQIAF